MASLRARVLIRAGDPIPADGILSVTTEPEAAAAMMPIAADVTSTLASAVDWLSASTVRSPTRSRSLSGRLMMT